MGRTRNGEAAHALHVRTPRHLWAVDCRPVLSGDLAVRLALLLRDFLAVRDPEFVAAARWAFAMRAAIETAGVDPRECSVLVVRGAGAAARTLAEFRVADDPGAVVGRVVGRG